MTFGVDGRLNIGAKCSKRMKIAIIGAGISGLGAAYLLQQDHDVTIYEKNTYIGGHSRTIDVSVGAQKVPVDTGFIVFNDWNYPHLLGLFSELGVKYEKSDMSFGVSIARGWLEYSSSNLFAQKRNFLSLSYWRMLLDIVRFNRAAKKYLNDKRSAPKTLGSFLDSLNVGSWFTNFYLLPMGAAIWSAPVNQILEFPAYTYLRFFKNHGLLNIIKRPQWYTVSGGSREYIKKICQSFRNVDFKPAAIEVTRHSDTHVVQDIDNNEEEYDAVVMACHADEALEILKNPLEEQIDFLSSFKYQKNNITVHTDENFMPMNTKSWASWVYLSDQKHDNKSGVSLSYWMNNLQNLKIDAPLIVTLNSERQPDKHKILDEHSFDHPIFDEKAVQAQKNIDSVQGKNNIYFCGAYQRYGFHEDGFWSAVRVAEKLGAEIPWK